MQEFNIEDVQELRSSEEIGLHLCFYERKIRGSNETVCVLEATEEGRDGFEVNDTIAAKSWKDMKKQYPTLIHILEDFARSDNWEAGWREHDRILYVASMEGHEGLYDTNEVVYLDLQELHQKKEKKKTAKKK